MLHHSIADVVPAPAAPAPLDFLDGGAEMGALIRGIDWAATPLGAVEAWPQSLRTAASICLASRFPLSIWWGPEYVLLYNDAYRPMLGQAKHPRSMGQPALECWAEVAHIIKPMLDGVMQTGKATWQTNQLLPVDRNGYLEEAYFTYSYSPIRVESGAIGGVFCVVTETTESVVGDRRLRQLRRLSVIASESRSAEGACRACHEAFDPSDVPFSLVYLVEHDGTRARLVAATGVSEEHAAHHASVDLASMSNEGWPLAKTASSRVPELVDDVVARFGALPGGPWAAAPTLALVIPVMRPGEPHPFALLVTGVSPARALDGSYRDFFELAADHLATALVNSFAAEANQKRVEALAEIDRVKTRFFANVSHEFRTPLTLLLGPMEEALASTSGSLAGEPLAMAHRNAGRLLKLVNDLLEFSRVEAGRADASYRPTDLAALTADLASAFRSSIERAGIVFEVSCPALPHDTYVDRDMWEKIILNLLSNALKFTFDGKITVVMRSVDAGAEIVISDTGTGIAASELPQIFGRFHRVAGARSRTHEGSGIGLAVVHELVSLHGGSIRVTSEADVGTTFTISLPWGSAHLPAAAVAEGGSLASIATHAEPYVDEALRWLTEPSPLVSTHRASAAHSGGEPRPRGRILLVDDNADMRAYLARLLCDRWDVTQVADGAAALEAALASPPDLVVTDVMMPRLDGFGLLRALRSDPRTVDVPVMMLSARANAEARVEGVEAGADDYLVKPFHSGELLARVHLQVSLRQTRVAVDRQRAELFEAFMQAPVPICVLRGAELRFEMANPLYCKFIGRDGALVVGKPLGAVMPELEGTGLDDMLLEVMRSGVPKTVDDLLIRLDIGGAGVLEETFWSFTYAPLRDVDGRVDRVLALIHHTTDRVRTKRELEFQVGRAEGAIRAKDEFLAMLGHELRNPLAPILTALQLLELRGDQSKERAIIERQVKHLVRLVDDLLDVSRIARGQVTLKREPLEIAEIVAAAIEIASPLIDLRKHRLSVDVPDFGVAVHGDRVRLIQVVSNLLTNAAKYMDIGGTILVSAGREGHTMELSVRDSGIGIAPSLLPVVFDLFTQERQTIERPQGGLGLGLAIVQSLVRLHGGEVSAESAGLGAGSEFRVRLQALDAPAQPALSTRGNAAYAAAPIALRVLVVDDNVDAAEMLQMALEALGYTVMSAYDGSSALKIAAEFAPDVGLLDIGLPMMDGYELARRLRSDPARADMRLIALTGFGQPKDVMKARRAGFDEHVLKPLDLHALQDIIQGTAV